MTIWIYLARTVRNELVQNLSKVGNMGSMMYPDINVYVVKNLIFIVAMANHNLLYRNKMKLHSGANQMICIQQTISNVGS